VRHYNLTETRYVMSATDLTQEYLAVLAKRTPFPNILEPAQSINNK
jgi:hypothetical protein